LASIFHDRDRCPGCLSWVTDTSVAGFIKCESCGLIAAKDRRTTVSYNSDYVADRYDKYPTTEKMSQLRARLVQCVIDLYETLPAGKQLMDCNSPRLLDVGYGNGSFIRRMVHRGWDAYGHDVNPTIYDGVRTADLPVRPLASDERYKAISFFDALEHFEELNKVRYVADNTDWIFLSFPNAPEDYPLRAAAWKHYRPGEHHFAFRVPTLEKLFSYERHTAKAIYVGSPEDSIRGKRADGEANILTVALKIEHLQ
jgi:methyltransferase family protein